MVLFRKNALMMEIVHCKVIKMWRSGRLVNAIYPLVCIEAANHIYQWATINIYRCFWQYIRDKNHRFFYTFSWERIHNRSVTFALCWSWAIVDSVLYLCVQHFMRPHQKCANSLYISSISFANRLSHSYAPHSTTICFVVVVFFFSILIYLLSFPIAIKPMFMLMFCVSDHAD